MKMLFEFEAEENQTNIGIAKALTELPSLNEADLAEIGKYLLVYSDARAVGNLGRHKYELEKGGVVSL